MPLCLTGGRRRWNWHGGGHWLILAPTAKVTECYSLGLNDHPAIIVDLLANQLGKLFLPFMGFQ